MKLAFTTLGCPEWTFEHIVEEASRLGFEAVEIRGVNGQMRAENIPEFFPENFAATKAMLDSHGISMICFGSSAKFHTEEYAADGIEECKKAVDVCARIGIPRIRVFGDDIPDPARKDETVALIGNSIREICQYAQGTGVDILVETHGGFRSNDVVAGVIEICKDFPNFGILWDVQHIDKTYGDNWMTFYEMAKPYIRHMHFKDHIRNADGTFTLCLPGKGDIPLEAITKTLLKDGYQGCYTLEWEKKWVPELDEPDVALPVYRDLMHSFEQ